MSTVDMNDGETERATGRRRFLGRAWKTVMAGAGLALIPGQVARASTVASYTLSDGRSRSVTVQPDVGANCCLTTTQCSQCSGYKYRYRCVNTVGGATCCFCTNTRVGTGSCFGGGAC